MCSPRTVYTPHLRVGDGGRQLLQITQTEAEPRSFSQASNSQAGVVLVSAVDFPFSFSLFYSFSRQLCSAEALQCYQHVHFNQTSPAREQGRGVVRHYSLVPSQVWLIQGQISFVSQFFLRWVLEA